MPIDNINNTNNVAVTTFQEQFYCQQEKGIPIARMIEKMQTTPEIETFNSLSIEELKHSILSIINGACFLTKNKIMHFGINENSVIVTPDEKIKIGNLDLAVNISKVTDNEKLLKLIAKKSESGNNKNKELKGFIEEFDQKKKLFELINETDFIMDKDTLKKIASDNGLTHMSSYIDSATVDNIFNFENRQAAGLSSTSKLKTNLKLHFEKILNGKINDEYFFQEMIIFDIGCLLYNLTTGKTYNSAGFDNIKENVKLTYNKDNKKTVTNLIDLLQCMLEKDESIRTSFKKILTHYFLKLI